MERLSWVRPFDTIKSGSLAEGNMSWFTNGQINACYQCCDRHDPEKIAITWEGNEVRAPPAGASSSHARVACDH
jgi:acetyl-CoA synthetase|eukprot:COSAG06_NODE_2379_length_6982_cov_7.713035_2_plen_74_part_00